MQQKSLARGFLSGPRCGAGKCTEAHLGLSVRGREWTNTRPLAAQERLCLTGRPSSRGSSGCSSLGGHQGGARPCCAGGSAGRLQEPPPHLLRPETTLQVSLRLLLLLLSLFSRVRLCATHRQQPTRLPRPWDSPGKDTGVGAIPSPMHESEK